MLSFITKLITSIGIGPILRFLKGLGIYGKGRADQHVREKIKRYERTQADVELRNKTDQRVHAADGDDRQRMRNRWTRKR